MRYPIIKQERVLIMKILARFVIIFGLFYFISSAAQLPEPVFLPNYTNYYDKPEEMLISQFYPVGWSKNGLFAFVTCDFEETLDSWNVVLVINNLKTDNLTEGFSSSIEPAEDSPVSIFWKSNRDTLEKLINKYGIILRQPAFDIFPLKTSDESLTVVVKEVCDTNNVSVLGLPTSDSYKLIAIRGNNTKKIIREIRSSNICGSCQVEGFIKSPFEHRIAVVTSHRSPGWEGPPSIITVMVTGCHIEKGFKKLKE
jgi:hypothetical protein